MLTNEYLKRVYAEVEKRDAHEPEFLQAEVEQDAVCTQGLGKGFGLGEGDRILRGAGGGGRKAEGREGEGCEQEERRAHGVLLGLGPWRQG